MHLTLISFTKRGAALCRALCGKLEALGHLCRGFASEKYAQAAGLPSFGDRLSDWAKEWFTKERSDGMIFIGACGIAVRAVAPYLQDKTRDPAVVVVDEHGKFAISLLSGHIGNANKLAQLVAEQLHATPVISTATDCNGLFAVDSWAAHHGWSLSDMTLAKEVSARLLDGEPVGFRSELPFSVDELPVGFTMDDTPELGVFVTIHKETTAFPKTLRVIPRTVSLGIGCRKGTPQDVIESMVQAACAAHHLDFRAVGAVATIDLKREEPGLLAFVRAHGLAFPCFSAQELRETPGCVTPSAFVQEVTGVDNVCERAALLGSGGTLLFPKQAGHGVTVAAAHTEGRISFAY